MLLQHRKHTRFHHLRDCHDERFPAIVEVLPHLLLHPRQAALMVIQDALQPEAVVVPTRVFQQLLRGTELSVRHSGALLPRGWQQLRHPLRVVVFQRLRQVLLRHAWTGSLVSIPCILWQLPTSRPATGNFDLDFDGPPDAWQWRTRDPPVPLRR